MIVQQLIHQSEMGDGSFTQTTYYIKTSDNNSIQ